VVLVYLNLPKLNKKYRIGLVITITGTLKKFNRFFVCVKKEDGFFCLDALGLILAQEQVQVKSDDGVFLIIFPEQCRVLPAYPPASYEQGDENQTNECSNTDNNPDYGNFIWFF
jgi:hypothetical protein